MARKRRFTAAQRRAQRLFAQRARAGSLRSLRKKRSRPAQKKVHIMARKRGRARRSYGAARRGYSRASSSAGFGGIGNGAIGGVIDNLVSPLVPIPGVGLVAAGYVTKERTLQVMGGYQLGKSLTSGLNLGGILGGGAGAPAQGSAAFV